MTSDALWLLKRQSFLIAREQVLVRLIRTVDHSVPDDEEIIEGITFSHVTSEAVQRTAPQTSKTEYIALNMESLRTDKMEVQERRTEQWNKELELECVSKSINPSEKRRNMQIWRKPKGKQVVDVE